MKLHPDSDQKVKMVSNMDHIFAMDERELREQLTVIESIDEMDVEGPVGQAQGNQMSVHKNHDGKRNGQGHRHNHRH